MTSTLTIPSTLEQVLLPHQIEALHFLWRHLVEDGLFRASARTPRRPGDVHGKNDDEPHGCILAHPSGLGKTFTTLSFLLLLQAHVLLMTLRTEQQQQRSTGLRAAASMFVPPAHEGNDEDHLPLCPSLRVLVLCPGSCVRHWRNSMTNEVRETVFGRLASALPVYTPTLSGAAPKHVEETLVNGYYRHGGLLVVSYVDFVRLLGRAGGVDAISTRRNGTQVNHSHSTSNNTTTHSNTNTASATAAARAVVSSSSPMTPASTRRRTDERAATDAIEDGVAGSRRYARVRSLLERLVVAGSRPRSPTAAHRTVTLLEVLRCADVLVLDDAHRLRRVRARWVRMLQRHMRRHACLRLALTRLTFAESSCYHEAFAAICAIITQRAAATTIACAERDAHRVHEVRESVAAQLLPPRRECVVYVRLSQAQESVYRTEMLSLAGGGTAQRAMCATGDVQLHHRRRLAHLYFHPDWVLSQRCDETVCAVGEGALPRRRKRVRESGSKASCKSRDEHDEGGETGLVRMAGIISAGVHVDAINEAALLEDDDNVIEDRDGERRRVVSSDDEDEEMEEGKETKSAHRLRGRDHNYNGHRYDDSTAMSRRRSTSSGSGGSSTSKSHDAQCSMNSTSQCEDSDTNDGGASRLALDDFGADASNVVYSATPVPHEPCLSSSPGYVDTTCHLDLRSSPKLQVVLCLIRYIADELLEKVVVLSAYGTHLTQLAQLLKHQHGIRARVIHTHALEKGMADEIAVDSRLAAAEEFAQSAQRPVLLAVTRAVGSGLQLTAANHCIVLDVACGRAERAAEAHAIERVVRLGHVRPVTVYRLVAHGTTEQRVWQQTVRAAKLHETRLLFAQRDDDDVDGVASVRSASLPVRHPASSEDAAQESLCTLDCIDDNHDNNNNNNNTTDTCKLDRINTNNNKDEMCASVARSVSSELFPMWSSLLSCPSTDLPHAIAAITHVSPNPAASDHTKDDTMHPKHTTPPTLCDAAPLPPPPPHHTCGAGIAEAEEDILAVPPLSVAHDATCTHTEASHSAHNCTPQPAALLPAPPLLRHADPHERKQRVWSLAHCEPALRETMQQAADDIILHAIQHREESMGESLHRRDTEALVQETEAMLVQLLWPWEGGQPIQEQVNSTRALAEALLLYYQRGVSCVLADTLDTAAYVKLRVYLSRRLEEHELASQTHTSHGSVPLHDDYMPGVRHNDAYNAHDRVRTGTSAMTAGVPRTCTNSTTRTRHVLTDALLCRPYALWETIRPKECTMMCTELGVTCAWAPHCLLVGLKQAAQDDMPHVMPSAPRRDNEDAEEEAQGDNATTRDCGDVVHNNSLLSGVRASTNNRARGVASSSLSAAPHEDGAAAEARSLCTLATALLGVLDRPSALCALHDCLRQRWPHGAGLTLPPLPVSHLAEEERLMRAVYAAAASDAATATSETEVCALTGTSRRHDNSHVREEEDVRSNRKEEGGGCGVFDATDVAALLQLSLYTLRPERAKNTPLSSSSSSLSVRRGAAQTRFHCPRCRHTCLQRTAAWALRCRTCHYDAEFELLHHPLRHHHAQLYQLSAVTELLRRASVRHVAMCVAERRGDGVWWGGVLRLLHIASSTRSTRARAESNSVIGEEQPRIRTLPERCVEAGVSALLQPLQRGNEPVSCASACMTPNWLHGLRIQCGVSSESRTDRLRRLLCANGGVVWARRLRPHMRAALLRHVKAELTGVMRTHGSPHHTLSSSPLLLHGPTQLDHRAAHTTTLTNTAKAKKEAAVLNPLAASLSADAFQPPTSSSSFSSSEFAAMAASSMPMMSVVTGLHTMMTRVAVQFAHELLLLLPPNSASEPQGREDGNDENRRGASLSRQSNAISSSAADSTPHPLHIDEAQARMLLREVADGVVMLRYVTRIPLYLSRITRSHDTRTRVTHVRATNSAASCDGSDSSFDSVSPSASSWTSPSSSPSVGSFDDVVFTASPLPSSLHHPHRPSPCSSSASATSVSSSVRPQSVSGSDVDDATSGTVVQGGGVRNEPHGPTLVTHLKDVRIDASVASSRSGLLSRSSSVSSLSSRYSSITWHSDASVHDADNDGVGGGGGGGGGACAAHESSPRRDVRLRGTHEARLIEEYWVSFCEVYGTDAAGQGMTASLPAPSTAFWVAHVAHASREGMTMAAVVAEYVQRVTALSHKIRLIR